MATSAPTAATSGYPRLALFQKDYEERTIQRVVKTYKQQKKKNKNILFKYLIVFSITNRRRKLNTAAQVSHNGVVLVRRLRQPVAESTAGVETTIVGLHGRLSKGQLVKKERMQAIMVGTSDKTIPFINTQKNNVKRDEENGAHATLRWVLRTIDTNVRVNDFDIYLFIPGGGALASVTSISANGRSIASYRGQRITHQNKLGHVLFCRKKFTQSGMKRSLKKKKKKVPRGWLLELETTAVEPTERT